MFLYEYQGKRILDKNNLVGAAQLAGGTYLGYQGIKHGLPRALGLRIEYHTTSKSNADLIKKSGNFLDPKFGGKNGYAQKGANFSLMLNGCKSESENYVHITGLHKDSKFNSIVKNKKWLTPPLRTIYRKTQNIMYRTLELLNAEKCVAPTNIKEGGLLVLFSPALFLLIALETASTAFSCPITLLCKLFSKFNNF